MTFTVNILGIQENIKIIVEIVVVVTHITHLMAILWDKTADESETES